MYKGNKAGLQTREKRRAYRLLFPGAALGSKKIASAGFGGRSVQPRKGEGQYRIYAGLER